MEELRIGLLVPLKRKLRKAALRQWSNLQLRELASEIAKRRNTNPNTEEAKRKIGLANSHPCSLATRKKMSLVRKGIPKSEEHKANMRHSRKGYPKGILKSPEHKRKISEARKRYWSRVHLGGMCSLNISGAHRLQPSIPYAKSDRRVSRRCEG